MAAAQIIRADGIDWPLETYLDALDFRRVDPFDAPAIQGEARLVTITRAGELRAPTFADQIGWHDVIAFRPLDHGIESTPCHQCGERTMRVGYGDVCEDCESDGGWRW